MLPRRRKIIFSNGKSILSTSPLFTFELGRNLSLILEPSDVIALYGDLGTGKTQLIKGICAGLNVDEYVTSPSFSIINEYQGKYPIYHFDFYRLNAVEEVIDLGIVDYLYGDGICLIEWPELAEEFLPDHTTKINIEFVKRPNLNNNQNILEE